MALQHSFMVDEKVTTKATSRFLELTTAALRYLERPTHRGLGEMQGLASLLSVPLKLIRIIAWLSVFQQTQ